MDLCKLQQLCNWAKHKYFENYGFKALWTYLRLGLGGGGLQTGLESK